MSYGSAHRVELQEEHDKLKMDHAHLRSQVLHTIARLRSQGDDIDREEAAQILERAIEEADR